MPRAIGSTISARRSGASSITSAISDRASRPRRRSSCLASTASWSTAFAPSPTRCSPTTERWRSARAAWGGLFAALGSLAYYLAYGLIVWRTVTGEFSIGDLTFLAGSFLRLRGLLEGLLLGFSQIAGQALYLEDLFSFFDVRPAIASPPDPRPVPAADARQGSCSRMSASAIPAVRSLGRAPPQPDAAGRARWWRWSARTAPARPRSSSCWPGSTIRPRGASCSTAMTCAPTT